MSDTNSRVIGCSMGASAASWQPTSKIYSDPDKSRVVVKRTNVRSNQRDSRYKSEIEQELQKEAKERDQKTNAPRFSSVASSSYTNPGSFGKVGKRIMKTQDGKEPRLPDIQSYEFGLHERKSRLDRELINSHFEGKHYSEDHAISHYTQRYNEGTYHHSGATNTKLPFSKNASFTADIMDGSKRHAEGVDTDSGKPSGTGTMLHQPVGGSLGTRSVLSRILSQLSDKLSCSGRRAIAEIFRRFDSGTQDKELTPDELKRGLKDNGVSISKTQMDQLFAHFDRDHSGAISFNELYVTCRDDMNVTRQSIVKKAFAALEGLTDGNVTLQFIKQNVRISEMPRVKTGRQTKQHAREVFESTWRDVGKEGNTSILLDDFMSFYRDVSITVEDDNDFQLLVCNSWNITPGSKPDQSGLQVKATDRSGRVYLKEIPRGIGIKRTEFGRMRANLHRQGLHNIVEIELVDSGEKKCWAFE